MMTSSNGTFSALLAICAGNSPVSGDFPAQRPVTRSFGVFFDLRLYKLLRKQWRGWWFETPSRPLWRQCNACQCFDMHNVILVSRCGCWYDRYDLYRACRWAVLSLYNKLKSCFNDVMCGTNIYLQWHISVHITAYVYPHNHLNCSHYLAHCSDPVILVYTGGIVNLPRRNSNPPRRNRYTAWVE